MLFFCFEAKRNFHFISIFASEAKTRAHPTHKVHSHLIIYRVQAVLTPVSKNLNFGQKITRYFS